MPETAIIILNWNNHSFLRDFLPSLIQHTPKDLAEIVIADNGSTDESVEWLEKTYPDIRMIRLGKNFGFAGGYNRAINQCSHRHVLILNSDIEVSDHWLPPLLARIEDPLTAAVMPKILSWHRKTHFEYAGAAGGFVDKYGYPFCRGRIFDQVEEDLGQYDAAVQIHWSTGAGMLIKRAVFEEAGGFDDDFFAHMEEIDLCWRIRRLGYQIWVEPASRIFHVGGGSLPNESPHKLYLNFRNNLALLYKNTPDTHRLSVMIVRMILDGVAALSYLAKGKFPSIRSILKAHRDFYTWRKKLKISTKSSQIPAGTKDLHYQKSIVFQFFVRKRKKFSDLNL